MISRTARMIVRLFERWAETSGSHGLEQADRWMAWLASRILDRLKPGP
jgi:hypothetical protein